MARHAQKHNVFIRFCAMTFSGERRTMPPFTPNQIGSHTMKRAFITGITGQDGSYLAELLIQKGYEVHGLVRRSSSFNTQRIDHLYLDSHVMGVRMFLHYGDLSDAVRLTKLLYELRPDEGRDGRKAWW